MKRLAGYTAIILATLAVAYLLWQFRDAVILFILSLALSAILRPVVDSLAAHRMRRGLALFLTYFTAVLIAVATIIAMSGPLLGEIQRLTTDIPAFYRQTLALWGHGNWLQQTISKNLPDSPTLFHSFPSGQWSVFFRDFLTITSSSLQVGSDILIVFVLSIYWSADEQHFKRLWLSLLPSTSRMRWRDVWENIEKEIGAYLRSELFQSYLTLLLLWIGYRFMGLRYPVMLALFAAFSWLIVWFGGLAAIILGFIAGLSVSPLMAVAAAVYTTAVLAFLEYFIQPRLFNRAWISSLLILIMVLFMVTQFGLLGFLIAPPLAGVIQIFVSRLVLPVAAVANTPVTLAAPPSLQIDVLKERLANLQAGLASKPESATPEITSLVQRLQGLLDQAKQEDPFTDLP